MPIPMTSIGDLASNHANRLQTTRIKAEMQRLTSELSTGRPVDPVAHLGGDTARLALLERNIAVAQARAVAATGLGQYLSTMQTVLGEVDAVRGGLAAQLVSLTESSTHLDINRASQAGAGAFRDVVGRLNGTFGGNSLFAGTASDGPALADAEAMLASLSAAAAGSITAADVRNAVDAWFDDPAGGFATMGYLGDTGDFLTRRIDEGVAVTVSARADHPVLKDLMRQAAYVALASDPALALPDSTADALVRGGLSDLFGLAAPLTGLRADLGLEEERTTEAATRNGAMAAALTLARNEIALVDPFATAVALTQTETQLETQFAVTARLSGLSLVNFLR
jgi:flagellar hook-associated protein 3 FlgL